MGVSSNASGSGMPDGSSGCGESDASSCVPVQSGGVVSDASVPMVGPIVALVVVVSVIDSLAFSSGEFLSGFLFVSGPSITSSKALSTSMTSDTCLFTFT